MVEFTFTALTAQGATIQEPLKAENEEEAVRQLHQRGYVVLALVPEDKRALVRTTLIKRLRFGKAFRVKPEQVVALTREFAIMIETGVPLVEALDLLIEHSDNIPIREALVATRTGVSEGQSMAQAMGMHLAVFPRLYVDMIKTAELSGTLTETLNQAADYQEYVLEMRRKVRGALTYPAVLISFACAVMLFMLLYLIPQFHAVYEQMHAEIPVSTQILFRISLAMRAYWQTLPIVGIGGFLILKQLLCLKATQKVLARLMHRLPIIGDTVTKVAMARLLRTLGTLLNTGVSLLPALAAAAATTQDPLYEQAFVQICEQVEQGRTVAAAMSDCGVIPALVCQMVAVGEKSGRLSSVLQRMARYYEQEVDARLKALTSVIEPIMVAAIGIAVGFIAIAVIGPIYSVLDSIK